MKWLLSVMSLACVATVGAIAVPYHLKQQDRDAQSQVTMYLGGEAAWSEQYDDLLARSDAGGGIPALAGSLTTVLAPELSDAQRRAAAEQWLARLETARRINEAKPPQRPKRKHRAAAPKKSRSTRRPITRRPRSIMERSRQYQARGSAYPLGKVRHHGKVVRRIYRSQ